MKTILFFDRCDLTKLYILLTKHLSSNFNIIHVAFSAHEEKLLKEAEINDYINYQDIISHIADNVAITGSLLKEIDDFVYNTSCHRFTLNGSIQSDRGFTTLSYDEALKASACHYLAWKEIFNKHKVALMYHEPCSMFMTHIAALLCKDQGGIYRYPVQQSSDLDFYSYLNIDGENYDCKEIEDKYKYYSENKDAINKERCEAFLKQFRESYNVFLEGLVNNKMSWGKLLSNALKNKIIYFLYKNKFDKIKDNIDYWLVRNNKYAEKLRNIWNYKRNHIRFCTEINEGEKYYYYSLHLEPEATVLYLGEGMYTNQIKLIENIAASLPVGYYLYVKDHPHEYAYRKADDYARLLKVPNIRLIHQGLSGKQLIKNSQGVFTINGTAGFEGLLLGKQVYCFGQSYYSFQNRINYIRNIRDLKDIVHKNQRTTYNDDEDLYAYLCAYLESMHKGFVTYFSDRPEKAGINQDENAMFIANDIIEELK